MLNWINFSIFKNTNQKKKVWFSLFLVLLLAGFLRVYKLGQQSLIADEFLGMNISYGYAQTGQWKFWDFNFSQLTDEIYTRAQVYFWQVAQVWNWLPLGEGNARLVSVAWGMLSIGLLFGAVYYFSRNWRWAFLAALFLAISPSALTFDRKLRMYSMFAPVFFLFSLSIFFFLESRARKLPKVLASLQEKTDLNWLWLPAVVLLGILSLATHLLTVNIFPIVVIYLLAMSVKEYLSQKKIFNRYSAYLTAMVVVVLLAIQNQEIRDSLNFFSWVSNWSYFEKLVFDYSHPLLAATFLFLGGYYLVKNFDRWGIWVVANFLTILLLAAFIWKRNAGLQYLYFVTPFKVIIFSAGVYFLLEFFSERLFSGSRKAFWLMGIFAFLLLPNWAFFSSPEGFYQNIKKWQVPNYREVYGYYVKKRQPDAAIVSRPLTSYYLNKTNSALLDYGVDNPLTLERILAAQKEHSEIWAVFTKDTYIKSDAEQYLKDNFELIKTNYTNNILFLYVWRR